MAYPHKWSSISYKSSAGQRKHIGERPMLYRWTTQLTRFSTVFAPLVQTGQFLVALYYEEARDCHMRTHVQFVQ